MSRLFPDCEALFRARAWTLFPHIDRVYVNDLARAQLDWRPRYDFRYTLDCLRADQDFRSRFHIGLARLRDFEQARSEPDFVVRVFLRMISEDPTKADRLVKIVERESAAHAL